jgi:hypothetical protein
MARKKKIDTTTQNLINIEPDNSDISNISLNIENEDHVIDNIIMNTEVNLINKPKRGRKSKKDLELINSGLNPTNNVSAITNNLLQMGEVNDETNDDVSNSDKNPEIQDLKPAAKKRGRKPKGGKIIQQLTNTFNVKETKSNVILHLKCHIKDLNNNIISNNVNGYNFTSNKNEFYEVISNNENVFLNIKTNSSNDDTINNDNIFSTIIPNVNSVTYKNAQYDEDYNNNLNDDDNYKSNKNNELKDLWKKLKNLQHSLHLNNINDKKSACFWCTYEFDNPAIYIPKHYIKESYHVYGCFCSPECATAYLMEENIDSSTKFERYHLLNHIYSKIYDYKKNIKPAPKPYYMLEKFYGNLNIQEYRSLLKNERLFLVVDKPLTRILPELHEDNDDFIINNKIISSNTYQIKRKLLQKQSKNNIVNEKFGLQQNSSTM